MSKKIVRVMVFYDDGTFDEVKATQESTLTYPPGVRSPEPVRREPWTPVNPSPWIIPPCSKCGSTSNLGCQMPDCPSGWGKPWDNSTKVID